jgi:hypothetical protein
MSWKNFRRAASWTWATLMLPSGGLLVIVLCVSGEGEAGGAIAMERRGLQELVSLLDEDLVTAG